MINTLRLSVLPSVITVLTNDFTLSPSSTFETTTKSPRLIQTFLLKKRMRSICYYYILSNIEVRFKQMPWTLEVKRNYNPDRTSSYSKKSIVYKHWTDCLNSRSDFFDLYERIVKDFRDTLYLPELCWHGDEECVPMLVLDLVEVVAPASQYFHHALILNR